MAVVTLRPAGAGASTAWPSLTGTTHWQANSDNTDATYSRNNTSTPRENDYTLTSSGLTTETITSIDVRFRARSETTATGQIQPGLRLGGVNSLGTNQTAIPTTATDYTQTNIPRPGGGSWTVADLATLQVVEIGSATSNGIRSFEMYVDVNYTAGGTTGQVKVYDGSSFAAKPVKAYNGSTWITKPAKVWNGSSWEITTY